MQKHNNYSINTIEKLLTILTILSLLLYNISDIFFSSEYNIDEIEHLHASWLIWSGQIPYRDFFEHHNPLLWYIFAPLTGIMYDNANIYYVSRIITYCVTLGSLYYLYKIIQHSFNTPRIWILSIIIFQCFSPHSRNLVEFRPDAYMNFFIIFGLWHYIKYLSSQKVLDLSLCFVAFSLSFFILQKSALILFFLGLYTLYMLYQKKIQIKHLVLSLIAPTIILAIFLLWLWYYDLFEKYWELNIELNSIMTNYYGYTLSSFKIFNLKFEYFNNLGTGSLEIPPEVILLCILLIISYPKISLYKNDVSKLILYVTISEIVIRLLTFSPLPHYYSFFILFSGVVISSAFMLNMNKFKKMIYLLTLYSCFTITLYISINNYNSPRSILSSFTEKIQYLIDNTQADETILNNDSQNYNIFRPNADYLWFLFGDISYIYKLHFNESFDINKIIIKRKPTIIFNQDYINVVFHRHRSHDISKYNFELLELARKYPEIQKILPDILLERNIHYIYKLDQSVVNKYYKPTELENVWILKDEYRNQTNISQGVKNAK